MGRTILFSPIGNTDPIKYQHDGSMLHICRNYQPDKIYLYLSKEMLQNHEADNRYVKTLELLGEKSQHTFEIEIIKNDKMIDVQDFDIFLKNFNDILANIEKEMAPEDTLLVNMASGTPAMKSALVVMATLAEYRFTPIQVSTPKRTSNLEYENRNNYDVLLNWEYDVDNEEDYINRCKEIKCGNLIQMLKINMIKKLIQKYEYSVAYEELQELKNPLNESAYAILELASERLKLNLVRANQLDNKYQFEVMPIKNDAVQSLFEYALRLQIKLNRKEYAEFLQGIRLVTRDLLENISKNKSNIDLSTYCDKKTEVYVWNRDKLINNFSSDEDMKEKISQLLHAEMIMHNITACEAATITEEWIREKIGLKPQELMESIHFLFAKANLGVKKEDWNAYEKMNKKILEEIQMIFL